MIVSSKFKGKKRNFRKRVSESVDEEPVQDSGPVAATAVLQPLPPKPVGKHSKHS